MKLLAIVAVATVVTLTESAVFAMVRHHSIASDRAAFEQLDRSLSEFTRRTPRPLTDRQMR